MDHQIAQVVFRGWVSRYIALLQDYIIHRCSYGYLPAKTVVHCSVGSNRFILIDYTLGFFVQIKYLEDLKLRKR